MIECTLVEQREQMQAEVERIGFTYLDDRLLSAHPDDWYLRFVLAVNNNTGEYVSWVHNASIGSLNEGKYSTVKLEAYRTFLERR